jgi:hypothetical protein
MLKHQHSLLAREVSFHSSTQLLSRDTQSLPVVPNHHSSKIFVTHGTPMWTSRGYSLWEHLGSTPHSVRHQGSTPLTCPHVLSTWDNGL